MIKKSRLKTTIVTILIMQIFFPITVYGKNITAEEKNQFTSICSNRQKK